MELSATQRIEVSADVLLRDVDGETVLLNIEREMYFGLDQVSTDFWSCLTTQGNLMSAYEALLGEFDVEPDRLRDDLSKFVDTLVDAGLVSVVAAT